MKICLDSQLESNMLKQPRLHPNPLKNQNKNQSLPPKEKINPPPMQNENQNLNLNLQHPYQSLT